MLRKRRVAPKPVGSESSGIASTSAEFEKEDYLPLANLLPDVKT